MNVETCIGCELCYVTCGREVFEMVSVNNKRKSKVERPYNCMVGYSMCSVVCPTEAISFPSRDIVTNIERESNVFKVAHQEAQEKHGKAAMASRQKAQEPVDTAPTRVAMGKRGPAVREVCNCGSDSGHWPYGKISLLVVMAVALAGCKVDQEKEVASYRDVLGATPSAAPLEPNAPLMLTEALERANAHNEQLAIKGEEYLQALIDKKRAVAGFLPTVSLTPTYTRQEHVAIAGVPSFFEEVVLPHTFDVPLASQLNVNVPQNLAKLRTTEATAAQQRSLLLDLQSTILLDVANVYYQILLSEAQVRVLEYSISVEQKRVEDTQSEYEAGRARAVDVAQSQAQLAQTRVSLLKAQKDAANGRVTLALLIGVPLVEGTLSDQVELPEKLPSKEQLLEAAWQNRQDLAAAQHQVEAAVHALQQAWSRYFPSVALDFTYFLSRESFPSEAHWVGVLKVSLPLFSAGLIHADVRTAWSRLRQAKLAQSYLSRQIDEQVTIALVNLREVQRQIQEAMIQANAAQKAAQQAEWEFNAGIGLNLNRLVAQNQWLNAQLLLTQARFAEKMDYLNLIRTLGRFDAATIHTGLRLATTEEPVARTTTDPKGQFDSGGRENVTP
jgi:outer membrane protein TolC/NAD-dependent dihydropyrimidine dehydrogenase PreA subunit